MQKKQAFIFFGASGSGKGTQADLLQKHLETIDTREVLRVETGKRFRELSTKDTYVGKLAAAVTNEGGLQPTFLSVWNWTEAFMQDLKENQHMIIDGSPRRRREPPILESAFDFFAYDDVHVIFLNVDNAIVKDRMVNRARQDDKTEKIDRRLAWFNEYVLPMLEYYRTSDRYHFHEIDGGLSVEDVHKAVVAATNL
jgi:adenylate kinase family enzyme